MADFHANFRQRDGDGSLLNLAEPGVHLLAGKQFLQPFQRLHMIGHDENHAGLLMCQRHVQHEEFVLCVVIETVET